MKYILIYFFVFIFMCLKFNQKNPIKLNANTFNINIDTTGSKFNRYNPNSRYFTVNSYFLFENQIAINVENIGEFDLELDTNSIFELTPKILKPNSNGSIKLDYLTALNNDTLHLKFKYNGIEITETLYFNVTFNKSTFVKIENQIQNFDTVIEKMCINWIKNNPSKECNDFYFDLKTNIQIKNTSSFEIAIPTECSGYYDCGGCPGFHGFKKLKSDEVYEIPMYLGMGYKKKFNYQYVLYFWSPDFVNYEVVHIYFRSNFKCEN